MDQAMNKQTTVCMTLQRRKFRRAKCCPFAGAAEWYLSVNSAALKLVIWN